MSSICTGHAGNANASELSPEQEGRTLETLSRPLSEQGIAAEFWSTHDLARWMHGCFGVEYTSESSCRCLLHMAGLSFHLPGEVDRRRADEAGVEARMTRIRAEIARLAGKPEKQKGHENEEPEEEERKEENNGDDVIVVSADEVRIEHEAITRRAWCKKGARTRIGVDRKRQSQSYIGFLHEADGNVDLMRLDWQSTSNIVKALTDLTLRYLDKRIVVVWDNAGWHKSKKLRERLGEGNVLERIRLINMPPYIPDKNPIERVWGRERNPSATDSAPTSRTSSTHSRPSSGATDSHIASQNDLVKLPLQLCKTVATIIQYHSRTSGSTDGGTFPVSRNDLTAARAFSRGITRFAGTSDHEPK